MVINILIKILLFLSLLPLTTMAQGNSTAYPIPDNLKNHYFGIVSPQLSPDSRIVIFKKSYEQNKDTLSVVDTRNPDAMMLQIPNSHSERFTKSGKLFFCSGSDAEVIDLRSKKGTKWKDVTSGQYMRSQDHVVITRNDSLLISDEYGKVLRVIPNIVNTSLRDEDVFYVSQEKNQYQLRLLTKDRSVLLHSSSQPGLIARRISENSFIVYEKHPKEFKIFYHNSTTNMTNEFRYNGAKSIRSAVITPIQIDQENIFLNLNFASDSKDKNAVEIWYGNDNKIDQRFFDDTDNKILIWNIKSGEVTSTQDKEHSHAFYVGNPKFLLSYDLYKHKDFTKKSFPYTIFRYDIASKKHEFLIESGDVIYSDTKGKYLITVKDGQWLLVNINNGEKRTVPVVSSRKVYFSQDSQTLLFENEESLDVYDILSQRHQVLKLPNGFRSKLANGEQTPISFGSPIYKTSYPADKNVLIHLWKKEDNTNAIASFNGKSLKMVVPPTQDYISEMFDYSSRSQLLFVRSNINKPPQIWLKGKTEKNLYTSIAQDRGAMKIKSEWISAKNSKGAELKGTLIYPLNFDKNKKYPMIVSIYESQRFESNQYLVDGMFGSTEGINSRSFIERGYFVFLPEIVFDARGTGHSALDCVESSLNALSNNPSIDFSRVGLIGHSHGGYETNFIATQSDKFAAYVAGAGNSDLVRSYHSYNYLWNGPFYWQFENGQYRMPGNFTSHKELYIDNSPVYHAEKVKAPILLWTGKKDENIDWQQSMEFYLALKRNHKPVIALFYPDDDHSLQKIENRVDLYSRISQWFDFHLKDIKSSEWILKMN